MYKVFVNNKPLIITESIPNNLGYADHAVEASKINDLASFVKEYEKETRIACVYLVDKDVKNLWRNFKSNYRRIYAAGGVVKNQDDKLLYIYRSGKWDLPKGKMEEGENIPETAVREVEEECGISKLAIVKELPTTYHTYEDKQGDVLKIVYWHEMYTEDRSELVPQAEEGIEKACWLGKDSLKDIYKNTFASIKYLLEEYYSY